MKEKEKVAIAMSGGVDSGVAAALLVEEGYEVLGIHLNLWTDPAPRGVRGKGVNEEAARETAVKLGIPFYVKDYAKDFKRIVVDYFLAEYAAGRTPNPCVVCNQLIKFGKLLEYARALGCDYLATGHYARIEVRSSKLEARNEARSWKLDNRASSIQPQSEANQASSLKPQVSYRLLKGVDKLKDQSYFLWTLTQEKLANILFPVGDLTKPEVRKIARVKNLPISDRPESFEICFVLDNDYRNFLERHIPEAIRPGEVVNTKDEVIGEHSGLPLYTIGQRKGFVVKSLVPLYVVGVDVSKNQLIVGRGVESERRGFRVGSVNWISGERGIKGVKGINCEVRTHHQGPLLNVKVKMQNAKTARVFLGEPTRGVTPGQSAVFYQGEEVLGGGVIEN